MRKSKLGLLALLSTCCLVQAAETPQFHAELLPPLEGAYFFSEKINNLGHIAITSHAPRNSIENFYALRLLPGTTNYQSAFPKMSDVDYIDDLAYVYGKYYQVFGMWAEMWGYYRSTGHTNAISHEAPFTSSGGLAVNNSGFTFRRSKWGGGDFIFVNWPMQPRTLALPLETAGNYFDVAINQSGTVVGGGPSTGKAFLWNPEKFIDIEALGNVAGWPKAFPVAINEKEYVIGTGKFNGQTNTSSFIWHASTGFQLLPSLGGDTTVAAINNQNWIVGTSNGKGCLWVDGQVYDLNEVGDLSTNRVITSATQINEYGTIVAVTWPTAPPIPFNPRNFTNRHPALLQLTNLPVISAAAASTNDNFASRTLLTGAASVVVANNQSATTEVGEPAHAGTAAEKSLWWSWQASRSQTIEVNTLGSWIDTRIAIYRGTNLNSLELVASNDNYGTNQVSLVRFTAQADEVYQIAVDSTGSGGKILLRVLPQLNTPKGAFAEAAPIPTTGAIESNSILASTEVGEPDLPDTALVTLWFKWSALISGKVALVPLERSTNRPISLNLYTGNVLTNLTRLPSVASNANGVVVFQVQAGQEYKLRTLEPAAASGEVQFELLHGIELDLADSATPGLHQVKLKGPYTQEYELQQSTNLVTWDTIQEGTIGSNNQASFSLPDASGSTMVFYRSILKP